MVAVMLHSIGLGNSYFPTRSFLSEVGVLRSIPSFPLGNTTFPTSVERYVLQGNFPSPMECSISSVQFISVSSVCVGHLT